MKEIRLLTMLLVGSGLPIDDVFRVIETAPRRYKTYLIPKRSGGWREIAQPARELKALQYVLLNQVLSEFPVHAAASAYEQGRSIKANADKHAGARRILKLDFRSFFPSIKPKDWEALVRRSQCIQISNDDLKIMSRLLFWGGGSVRPVKLSIGAPTSPRLSNLILYDLDCALSQFAAESGVSYTRYADDITLSGNQLDAILLVEKEARRLIKVSRSPNLSFNEEKRGLYHRGQRQMVTGLILTPNGKVSIGRDRKRLVSSLLHKVKLGIATPAQIGMAKGYLAFAISAEAAFVNRMRHKYGTECVSFVLSFEIPPRT